MHVDKVDDAVVRSIGDAPPRPKLTLEEMLEVAELGNGYERSDLSGTSDLPEQVVTKLSTDGDLDVIVGLLMANEVAERPLRALEARMRDVIASLDAQSALPVLLGTQTHASTEAKLRVRLEDLHQEGLEAALADLDAPERIREQVWAMWRTDPVRTMWTLREALSELRFEFESGSDA